MATATVTFGLVSIPVRLYPATRPASAHSFNLLHKKCGSRLKQQYVCTKDGEVVGRDDMVKGYEVAKGEYVVFTPEELKAIEEVSTHTIEISEFVPLSKVDPVYFDHAYYLGPDRGGGKAYRLLGEALQRSGRAALGRYAARGKEYLALLRPVAGRLVMQQLLHADEVRSLSEVHLEGGEPKGREVDLALRLVEQTATDDFHPENYPDKVRARVEALIDEKVQGKEITAAAEKEAPAKVIDLMEALKQSLSSGASGRASTGVHKDSRQAKPAQDERRPPRRAPRPAARTRAHSAGRRHA